MLKLDKREGRKNWRVRGTVKVWEDGKLVTVSIDRSTGTSSRKEAEAVMQQIQKAATEATLSGNATQETFGQAVVRYLQAGRSERYLDKPLDYYEFTPWNEITEQMIFDDGIRAYPHVKPDTIRRQWDVPIRAVINFAKNPQRRRQSSQRRTAIFLPSQAEDLINVIGTSDRPERRGRNPIWLQAMVTFMLGQGTRTGETIALQSEWVWLDFNRIVIPGDFTKNGNERIISLIPRVSEVLRSLPNIDEQGPIFRRMDGEPFKPKTDGHGGYIRNPFRRAVEAIGMDPKVYTPHVCRHSFATWSYSQHKDILRLKREGGWKSDEAERYVHLSSDELAAEAWKFNWAFSGPAPTNEPRVKVVK